MAGKTNLSATLFSQKKLLGKSSTGTHRADSNEPIPSGVQVAASTIFAETIPSTPHTTMFQVQSASLGGASTVEYVEFALEQVTGSTYDANSFDDDASAQSSGIHAYRLVLTSTYNTDSNNPNKGTFPFRDSQILHWTLGGLQLVGPQFSNDVPNPYNLTIYSGSRDVDDQIPLLDEIDWQIDYYSGILLVQDYDSSKIPTRAKGYVYVGKMLSASLGEISGSTGTGTGKDVGWYQSGNGSISTTGSLYIGTSTTSNPEIFFSSVGAATFNEQGRDVDFRIESSNKENAFTVDAGTDKVLILSGGAANSYNEAAGSDVNFYVSGSTNSRGSLTKGTAVFGGDVIVSGTLYDSTGAEISAGGGTGTVTSGTFVEPSSGHLVQTGSVSLAGTKGFTYKATDSGADTFFFVSGTIGSRGTGTAGAAVFSGDFVVSGTSYTGGMMPLSDNVYNLGSPSLRFANIYTGDLHLRNERGHWQLIEEEDCLTVTNKLTGKRYKILLEPFGE